MKCVHLDFHTSPFIEGIGEKFNKEEFTKVIKDSKVDLITVFAKCHHGYSYYPTKLGTVHPHLKFNLLKEQIEAIHDAGAKAPIYITMGWSEKDATEHPEWHQIDFWNKGRLTFGFNGGKFNEPDDTPLSDCSWITLCPVGPYKKYLEDITREVCEQFDPSDGVFYDICFMRDACACDSCRAGMKEMGLDPDNYEDARKYYRIKRIELMKDLTGIVHEFAKDAPVFYNGGADMNRPEYAPYQTHYELEDLPTAWGGYDLMPLRAKYFEKFGKMFWGMTGKFHHAWGEFGGFKNKDALKYECADMLSIGASMSVGDQLHPCGKLDESTYAVIGHAFDYVSKIEKYSENTKAYTDIALWISHSNASDMGCSKMLQIMHLDFDVVESGEDISKYKCVVLPDNVKFTNDDKKRIIDFVGNGGKIIASGKSIFDELGIVLKGHSGSDKDFIACEIDEIKTPFLSYSSAYVAESDGEVLARVHEPYFNRTYGHYCSHKNTPFKLEPADYPALIKKGNVLYFAHPVFEAYDQSGSYVLERYIKKAFDTIYDRYIRTENLPSCGRVRLRRSESDNFFALHVLYAPPVNRGNVCLLEDFPTLHNVKFTLNLDKKIKSIRLEPSGNEIEFKQNGNEVTFEIEAMSLHQLAILSW
ncbi:MAG: beta-galactosidase trimerization domain-containing protein [Clostridia bacterium]|nr:beta-galactosidase trimerization domain-containing protein [Clostridia bacterium]